MVQGRPGRPPLAAKRKQFARLIARGVGSAKASRIVGVHPKTGKRWRQFTCRGCCGCRSAMMAPGRPPRGFGFRVCGKGTKVVLIPLPPAVGRAIDRAIGGRAAGPILLNTRGTRMDRHAATPRLRRLAHASGVRIGRTHPHMLRHTFVTTM